MPAYDLNLPANHLAPVRFALTIDAPHADESDGDDDDDDDAALWTVRGFDIHEQLSRPTSIEIDAFTRRLNVDPGSLLGRSCLLSLDRGGAPRSFAGLIVGVEEGSRGEEQLGLLLRVAPALSLLRHRRSRRIWQLESVVDIITSVLRGPLAAHGRELRWALDPSTYEPREYCVQHGESDLDFVHRLLAEEGIYYRFEVEDGRELVTFADSSARAPIISVASADPDRRRRGVLPFIATGAGSTGEEAIRGFSWRRELVATATLTRTWDWRSATEPPAEHHIEDYAPDPGVAEADGDRTVHEIIAPSRRSDRAEEHMHRARHQRRGLTSASGRGEGDAINLRVGHRFALLGHTDPKCDRGYFLTRVRHRGDAPEAQLHAHAEGDRPRYRAELECIADDCPFQPPAPPRTAATLETAIVVGPPPPEEIHTDEHGRIQVRFHWDRRSSEEASTCWLRVAQSWAGLGFGALFIPRIGQEVVVDYLGGDPDRPLVVGCLYNSRHRPPFDLPEQKERSGLRSDSTPGGGGHHELSFDDTKGREVLRLRAQRDMLERVLHDQKTVVGRERTLDVGENYARTVGGVEHLSVQGSASRWIGAHYDVTVATGDLDTTVEEGDMTTTIAAGASSTQAAKDIDVESKTGSIKGLAHASISFESSTENLDLVAGESLKAYTRRGDIELHAEKACLRAAAAEEMTLSVTQGSMSLHAATGIGLTTTNLVAVGREGVLIKSPKAIVLQCGDSTLTISSTGISLRAATISSEAVGTQTISGATINLN